MAIDGMTYDQLLALANRNRDKDGGYNPYFMGNPDLQGLTVGSPNGVDPSFFLHNPETKQGAGGQGWKLTRGSDGSIQKSPYTYDSELGMIAPLAMATMPFWAPALGLGGAAAGGVDAAYLGAADAAGGLMPEFGTFGAYEAGMTGAGTAGLSSGASTLGSSASGAGDLAAAAGNSYAIPTAEELIAAGMDPAGMGLTGAGGIGAASSVAGAGAGAATAYGAGGGMLDTILGKGADFLGSKAGSAVVGGLLSGLAGKNAPNSTTATSRVELDPRMAEILYGPNGNDGFLSKITGNMNTPQNAGMQAFGQGMDAYLGDYGRAEFDNNMRGAVALRDMKFDAPTAQAAQVQAPSQNNLNLSPAYQDMVYGAPGANPYLTGAIQKGINQSTNAFTDMMSANTRNLMENVMPGIRGGARVSGNYGSDREGIAQGKALDTFNTQLGQAMQRFGQGNTDAAVAAQAGAYDTDRNRALSAMSGLGAQQYGVAQQNAQMQQQANLANMQSQLQTNSQNANNLQSGVGLSSSLLGQAAGYGQNQDAYQTQKLGQTAGLIAPFTGLGSTQTQTQPLYQNTLGNIAGGAMAGLGIYNMFK